MSQGPDVKFEESVEDDLAAYRAVSGFAVASLLLGVASALAIVVPMLWFVPLLGVFLSLMALGRLATGPTLVGRKAAILGLALSIIFGTAVPVAYLSSRWWLVREAQPTAEEWFAALRQGEPFKAHELSLPQPQRLQVPIPLAQYYSGRSEARREFEKFLSNPLARTLLALGDKCEARFYEAADVEKEGDQDVVKLVYAVTFRDEQGKKSFFVLLTLARTVNRDTRRGTWRIVSTAGGVRPTTLPE